MAIREVRIYFEGLKRQEELALNHQLLLPVTFYMDSVMRGRFKEYSGPEMKGINLVNLLLCNSKSPHPNSLYGWNELLNVYRKSVSFDLSSLQGTRAENVSHLVDVFVREAQDSPKPQMQKLIVHIDELKGSIDVDKVIKRADAYMCKLRESVNSRHN